MTNIDVSTSARAVEVEHRYRHRTQIENLFRDTKHGAALPHLPSGHHAVNRAWMWGGLLAATIAGRLHDILTATDHDGRLVGHGVRGGQATITTTLNHRLIAVPDRIVHHAGQLTLRRPLGQHLLARIRAHAAPS